jgi:hypothetical protein
MHRIGLQRREHTAHSCARYEHIAYEQCSNSALCASRICPSVCIECANGSVEFDEFVYKNLLKAFVK